MHTHTLFMEAITIAKWGIVIPACVFLVTWLFADKMFDHGVPVLEAMFNVKSLQPKGAHKVIIIMSMARSMAMLLVGIPIVIRWCHMGIDFMSDMVMNRVIRMEHFTYTKPDAFIIIASWATIMLIHRLGTMRLIDATANDEWAYSVVFIGVIAHMFVEHSSMHRFIAIVALGSMIRCMDFMHYAINHLFPRPGNGRAWSRFIILSRVVAGLFLLEQFMEQLVVFIMFMRVIWMDEMDQLTLLLVGYLNMMYHNKETMVMPISPVTTPRRDVHGFLTVDLHGRTQQLTWEPPPASDVAETLPPVVSPAERHDTPSPKLKVVSVEEEQTN